MKKHLLIYLGLTCSLYVHGQGTINFNNFTGTGSTDGSQYITNCASGERVAAGPGYLVQLFYGAPGAAENQLVPVTDAAINFSAPGLFYGGTRTLLESVIGSCQPGVGMPGQVATLQVRAWSASLGSTFSDAYQNAIMGGDGTLGRGNSFSVTTGNPCVMPPGLPAPLSGFRGFFMGCIPEPSTYFLGALGLFASFGFLRRKG